MGGKQTKFEGEYLPDTPTLKARSATMPRPYFVQHQLDEENKDPRSPSGCRTPMNLFHTAARVYVETNQAAKVNVAKPTQSTSSSEKPFGVLRKRLLKSFTFYDPRSPKLNRTPMIFDEAIDRTLNLDDTFSDLFVESRAHAIGNNAKPILDMQSKEIVNENTDYATVAHETPNDSSVEIVSLPYEEEETMPCPAVLQHTPVALQNQFDPRSPTMGVDRTPIIFNDDDEAHEDQMLENILETLTLNLSNDSSMTSFVSANGQEFLDATELKADESEQPEQALTICSKPKNKHLDRVRLGNKQRVPPRKPARRRPQQSAQPQVLIYEDNNENANEVMSNITSTPNKKSTDDSYVSGTKRTPLSCVKNRRNARSRSVEISNKARLSQLPLQSFDDQLNPAACGKMKKLHILQTAEDFLDASIY